MRFPWATAATARSMTFVRSMSDLTDDGVADVLLVSTTPGATHPNRGRACVHMGRRDTATGL